MKIFLYLFVLIFCLQKSTAQIIYESAYPTASEEYAIFHITNIGNDNYKYVVYDCYSDQFTLYNLDHSIYMANIQVPVTSDTCMRFSIGYISTTLFDCDSTTLEYALMPEQPIYPFQVYRTDGTLLFSKDSVYGYWCYGCNEASIEIKTIQTTPAGTKLFLHNPWSEPDSVLVYSLCGQLPDLISQNNLSNTYASISPNPSSHNFTINVSLPSSLQKENSVIIFDSKFQELRNIKVSGSDNISLSSSEFSSGTYYYLLRSQNTVLQSGKFIVTK